MFYKIVKSIVKVIFIPLFCVKVVHKERLKYDGKMMLAANHRSNFDPVFLHLISKHKVHFMAKKELFKNPLLGSVIRGFGAFPVERGMGDLGAIKNAFRILTNGHTLGIFPEGTRTRKENMRPFQHGVTMIAIRTDTPILPIYFSRTLRPFHRTYIIVGEPIRIKDYINIKLSDTENVKLATYYLFYRMQKLQHEAEALCR